ncbi:HAD domain-containing protein [Marinagarivorans cellulosilyticus]|uniref:Uncharacterized protein n=1 Tax=Marinagarivorans cellulosilyticus TaxID=2721545 RepID=A0AAN1WKM1_9GAMM|nr:HAD domain-containing protein [Marinagarivorans cellulosilyticus]BCD99237.1 hypothetical protein MARGE09_P3438 [Marinagarivorans cellulosilyticus]
MLYLFLDIDGVLRPDSKPNNYVLSNHLLGSLYQVVALTDGNLKIVVTSSWRLVMDRASIAKKLKLPANMVEVMPVLDDENARGGGVIAYMAKVYAEKGETPFMALDDQPDLYEGFWDGVLFPCEPDSGFDDGVLALLKSRLSQKTALFKACASLML